MNLAAKHRELFIDTFAQMASFSADVVNTDDGDDMHRLIVFKDGSTLRITGTVEDDE